MGKTKIISLILISIFLVGCTKNVEEDLPKEPPMKISNEIGNPPNIFIVFDDHGTPVTLDKYCWNEEENDKTCSIEPTPPEELLRGETHLSVAQGAELSFSFPAPYPSSSATEPLQPDKIELIQTKKDETSTFEVKNDEFKAPNEKGVYYYSTILTFYEDIKGEAIYAFSLSVR